LSLAWAADIEKSVMQPLLARAGAETLILGKDMKVVIGPQPLVGTRLALPATAFSVPSPHAYRVEKFDDGKTYLVGYSRMRGYSSSPGLDWTVLVRQDVTLAYAPVVQLRKQVMLVGGGIASLFAALAWPLSRHIARPLGALAASARRVELSESSHIDDIQGSYREIGQLRTALQSLVGQLQANEASLQQTARRKDEFLATLAHEFRNPLAPIAASADLLRLGRADAAQQLRLGEVIARQTRHMTGLIDGLMDVSRVTRGEVKLGRQAVDLRDVVADALEQTAPLIASKQHRVETRLALGPMMVMGDKKRLVQVLANLLNNAAKYTSDGGWIDVALSAQNGKALLSVRDNGIGMSEELMDHVFELFTQETRKVDLSAGGLGVGLALSKRLVDLHDGKLTVSSHGKDQGSEFLLALPMIVPTGATNDNFGEAQQQPLHAAAARVLIVDDNVDAANTLGMLVESLGYDARIEYQGQAAIERVRLAPHKICLLDIGMPVIDGYELASRLRALPEMGDAVLVAVTGYSQPSDRERALSRGFDDYIVKPVDLERLTAQLAKASIGLPTAPGTEACLD
jgi:signal transduction histidine kinase/ActR/RegA family two-component response regulator